MRRLPGTAGGSPSCRNRTLEPRKPGNHGTKGRAHPTSRVRSSWPATGAELGHPPHAPAPRPGGVSFLGMVAPTPHALKPDGTDGPRPWSNAQPRTLCVFAGYPHALKSGNFWPMAGEILLKRSTLESKTQYDTMLSWTVEWWRSGSEGRPWSRTQQQRRG